MLIKSFFYIFILSSISFITEANQIKNFFSKEFINYNKINEYKKIKKNIKYKKISFNLKESKKLLKKKTK